MQGVGRRTAAVLSPVSTGRGEKLTLTGAPAGTVAPSPAPSCLSLMLPQVFHIKVWQPYSGPHSFFPWNI